MRILLLVVLFFSISTLTYAQRGGAGFHGGGVGFRGGGGFVSGNRGSRSGFVRGGAFRGGFANPGFRRGFGAMRPGARFVFVPRNRFFFPRNRFFFPRNQFFFSFGGFSGFPIVTYPYGWASYPYSDDYGSNDYGIAPAPLSSQVDRQPDYYLIAFTDHTIRAAVHYWA